MGCFHKTDRERKTVPERILKKWKKAFCGQDTDGITGTKKIRLNDTFKP